MGGVAASLLQPNCGAGPRPPRPQALRFGSLMESSFILAFQAVFTGIQTNHRMSSGYFYRFVCLLYLAHCLVFSLESLDVSVVFIGTLIHLAASFSCVLFSFLLMSLLSCLFLSQLIVLLLCYPFFLFCSSLSLLSRVSFCTFCLSANSSSAMRVNPSRAKSDGQALHDRVGKFPICDIYPFRTASLLYFSSTFDGLFPNL